MNRKLNHLLTPLTLGALVAANLSAAQQAGSTSGPLSDTSFIDADGTAHVTRVVPVPGTISPEAQKMLARHVSDAASHETLEQRRTHTDAWQSRAGEESRSVYPVKSIENQDLAAVPVKIITPLTVPNNKQNRVLINVHGGGFNSDSGSLTETIPMANLTQTKVIAILYRLAPEHKFPAAVDDTVAVYKEVLKTYQPQNIALYGTSAGAILTGEVAVRLRQLGLPPPAALGVFSGSSDLSQAGDSQAIFALNGFSGPLNPPSKGQTSSEYLGTTDPKDPVASPLYGDLKGFPPTLLITSTRDLLLSGTTVFQRALLRAGVEAQLVVFEALPHAFWNDPHLPESKEADAIMAHFFDTHLGTR
jgi:acetyl esterase/lipase